MAIHSSMLAWEIPWTEEPGRLQSMGLQESGMTAAKQQQQRFVLGASEKQNEQDVQVDKFIAGINSCNNGG